MYTVFAFDDCNTAVVLYSGGSLADAHQAFDKATPLYESVCIQIQQQRPFSTVPYIQVIRGERPGTESVKKSRVTLTVIK